MCLKLFHLIWGIWWFHRSKEFEAMKAGKLVIQPWLSCQYNKNMLMDLPSSVGKILLDNSACLETLTGIQIEFYRHLLQLQIWNIVDARFFQIKNFGQKTQITSSIFCNILIAQWKWIRLSRFCALLHLTIDFFFSLTIFHEFNEWNDWTSFLPSWSKIIF